MTHTVTVTIGWPAGALWNNARVHHFAKARAVKAAKTEAHYAALEAKVGRLPKCASYTINCTFTPPNAPGPTRDMLNCRDALKSAFDGIASAMGVDDRIFKPGTDDFKPKDGRGRVEIEIVPPVALIELRGAIS